MVVSEIDSLDQSFPSELTKANSFLSKSQVMSKIYCSGEFDLNIFENCLGVVGSSRVTSYGSGVGDRLVSKIASKGMTIVSGFMYGVDTVAHKAALDVGGKTIAVLGFGITRSLPDYQHCLLNEILNGGGLIISEYGGDFPASKWTFPARNSIVAGLSNALLVVEAEENSGSLITAEYALKMGSKVFCGSGPELSQNSAGAAGLMSNGHASMGDLRGILGFFGKS